MAEAACSFIIHKPTFSLMISHHLTVSGLQTRTNSAASKTSEELESRVHQRQAVGELKMQRT